MKPLLLKISAWGPYAGTEQVDFAGMAENRLFLITGATGAGKTTVFDAIAFSLYGEVSGKTRQKDRLRSDFTDGAGETFVELTFSHGEKKYRIRRTPAYERAKKRGEGTVFQKETALFYLQKPEGEKLLAEGAKAVTGAVAELLRMDYSQFKQLSMIAQGEFLALLLEKSGDRKKIFRNIFHTEFYEKIQSALRDRAGLLRRENRELRDRREGVALGLDFSNPVPAALLDTEPYKRFSPAGEQAELLKRLKEQVKKEEILEQRCQKDLEILDGLKDAEESCAAAYRALDERKQAVCGYEGLLSEMEGDLEQSRAEDLQIPVLEGERAKVQIEILESRRRQKLWEEWKEVVGRLDEVRRDAETKKLQSEQGDKECKECEKRCTFLEDNLQRYAGAEAALERLLGERQQAEGRMKAAKCLEKLLSEEEAAERSVKKARQEWRRAEAECAEAVNRWQEGERLFRCSQAGLLARDLDEGSPCPVCGSLHHPARAGLPEQAVTREQADGLRELAAAKEKAASAASSACAVKKKEWEIAGLRWREQCRELGIGEEKQAVFLEISALEQQRGLLEKKIAEAEKDKQSLDQIRKDLIHWKKELARLRERQEQFEFEKADCGKKLSQQEGRRDALKHQLPEGYDGEAEFDLAEKLNRKEQGLCDEIQRIRKNREVLVKRQSEAQKLLEREQEEAERQKREAERQKKHLLNCRNAAAHLPEGAQSALTQLQKELAGRIMQNKKDIMAMEQLQKEMDRKEEAYRVIGSLASAAGGENPRNLELEQYVLYVYFDEVLQAANLRLYRMTAGRYQLFRVEAVNDARTKDMLGIEAGDAYTGRRRPVSTLSGGESFKAALSLALGMSDVVQRYAGGIRAEALFIDEGFGALDEESLDQALQVLSGLAGSDCMIGVISHVEELKERINEKVLIRKTASGSHILQ